MENDGSAVKADSLAFQLPDVDVSAPLRFNLTAIELDSDVEVGVRAPLEADHTVDSFPDPIQDDLEAVAEDALDWELLEERVGEHTLLDVGNLALDPVDDALEVSIDWKPGFRR